MATQILRPTSEIEPLNWEPPEGLHTLWSDEDILTGAVQGDVECSVAIGFQELTDIVGELTSINSITFSIYGYTNRHISSQMTVKVLGADDTGLDSTTYTWSNIPQWHTSAAITGLDEDDCNNLVLAIFPDVTGVTITEMYITVDYEPLSYNSTLKISHGLVTISEGRIIL